MLIKLSSDQYVFSDKITHMGKNWDYESSGLWRVTFGTEENVLILSQAHFDELLSCLPTPVEASKIIEAKQATDSSEMQAYNLMIRALGGQP